MKEAEKPIEKRLPMDQESFVANGNVYYFADSLSITRYQIYEELSTEMTFGTNFSGLMKTFREINDASQNWEVVGKAMHRIFELTYNQMRAIGNYVQHGENKLLKFCALFIVRAGEDLATWDEHLASEKINDWTVEGFAMKDFFHLAYKRINGFRENYAYLFQNELGLDTEALINLLNANKEQEDGITP